MLVDSTSPRAVSDCTFFYGVHTAQRLLVFFQNGIGCFESNGLWPEQSGAAENDQSQLDQAHAG
jgi:hypothetical protein